MTNLEELRFRLTDDLRWGEDNFVGDGIRTIFDLKNKPIQDIVVVGGGSYTAYATAGQIVFTTAPANGTAINAKYRYAAFLDTELNDIMTNIGTNQTVLRAAIHCVQTLQADASKRFAYTQGETKVSPGEVVRHLRELLETLKKELNIPRVMGKTHKAYKKETVKTDLSRWHKGYLK